MDYTPCTFNEYGYPTWCPPGDMGPTTVIVLWVLTGLATLFLILRIYCRIWRGGRLQIDDYILIISWVSHLLDDLVSQRDID
jgi:hypothetical protein